MAGVHSAIEDSLVHPCGHLSREGQRLKASAVKRLSTRILEAILHMVPASLCTVSQHLHPRVRACTPLGTTIEVLRVRFQKIRN